MTLLDYTRQMDILDPGRLSAHHFDLIGVGGIGSPTGLLLTKMGATDVRVFDPDEVSEVNLPCQVYRTGDLGRSKALASQELWQQFAGVRVEAVPSEAGDSRLRGIVVVGVDSMSARADIWDVCMRDQADVRWLIDARMGAETGVVFTLKPSLHADQLFYERSLYTDSDAQALPCTGRAVLFNTFFIAALIGRQVKRIVMRQQPEKRIDFNLDDLSMFVI